MANRQQEIWSSGNELVQVKWKVKNEAEFLRLCKNRGEDDPQAWLLLADKFHKAVGRRVSYLAEWCVRQAGIVEKKRIVQ